MKYLVILLVFAVSCTSIKKLPEVVETFGDPPNAGVVKVSLEDYSQAEAASVAMETMKSFCGEQSPSVTSESEKSVPTGTRTARVFRGKRVGVVTTVKENFKYYDFTCKKDETPK